MFTTSQLPITAVLPTALLRLQCVLSLPWDRDELSWSSQNPIASFYSFLNSWRTRSYSPHLFLYLASSAPKPWCSRLWPTRSLIWSSCYSSVATCWQWPWIHIECPTSLKKCSATWILSSSASSPPSVCSRCSPYAGITSRNHGTSSILWWSSCPS